MNTEKVGALLLSVDEAATRLGLKAITVRQWANRRQIARVDRACVAAGFSVPRFLFRCVIDGSVPVTRAGGAARG